MLEGLLSVFGISNLGFTETFEVGFNQDLFLPFIFNYNQTTSISEETDHILFNIYPNPTTTGVFVKTNPNQKIKKALISDLSGKSYFVDIVYQGDNHFYISLDSYPQGMYILRIWTEEESIVRKIIKL